MSQKHTVDTAFVEFEKDPEATYELSNIVEDLTEPDAIEYFLDKLKPFNAELFSMYQGSTLVRDLITRWARMGGPVTSDHFKNVSDWVSENINLMDADSKNQECLDMVAFYSPNAMYFSDDEAENARFSDPNMIELWVNMAMKHAENVNHWLYLIEFIAQPHSGSHLADAEWGKRILLSGVEALGEKDGKKLDTKAQGYF